jgi:predicted DNA-binding WGR domain protein
MRRRNPTAPRLGTENGWGYAVTVHPDLVSDWTLQREWGRVGSAGEMVIESFSDRAIDAERAGAAIERTK